MGLIDYYTIIRICPSIVFPVGQKNRAEIVVYLRHLQFPVVSD